MELHFIENAYNEIHSEIESLTDGTPTGIVVAHSKNGLILVDYLGQVLYGILDNDDSVSVNDIVLVGESSKVPVQVESHKMGIGISLGHNAIDIVKLDKTKMEHLQLLTQGLEKLNAILTAPYFKSEK